MTTQVINVQVPLPPTQQQIIVTESDAPQVGPTGTQGLRGPQGPQGDTGAQGPAGNTSTVTAAHATDVAFTIKGATAQAANLLEVKDHAGNVLTGFDSNGTLIHPVGEVSTTATAGTGAAPPGTVQGYLVVTLDGTPVKVPYYRF